MTTTTFTLSLLKVGPTSLVLSVRVPEESAPMVPVCIGLDQDGAPIEREERDYGNAKWPTDDEIAAEAARQLGFPVAVKFSDGGDDLLESIYRAERAADVDVRSAFADGRLFLITSRVSCRFDGDIDIVHVMSRPAGGEIRGYFRPHGSAEPLRIRTPNYLGDWPELDAEVMRIILAEGTWP